ncbi:MAG TPA: cytochrome c peroxidase [Parafilimonas sp.]|nr:cytochrome c peroxidase [Parafilimonas sp.]
MYRKHIILISAFIAGAYACNKGINAETNVFKSFQTHSYFPAPVYDFTNNPVTENGFSLGKKLFYDPVLSANNTISCATCHIQTAAFTHVGHSVSHGIYDRLGTRNTPPIMNLAWYSSFMWDGGVFDLDLQPIAPITNHVEMDDTMANVLNRLKESSVYPALFQKAFGDEGITTSTFLKSLSQFMVMCVSADSKYDSVMRKQVVFTETEQTGYALFKEKCSSCHKEPLFTDNSFRNNGLSLSAVNDRGRFLVTLQDSDKYKFKVPSLRNLSFTQPYMHDGRLLTLEAVLEHYENNVQNTTNLDSELKKNDKPGIALTDQDKQNIIAFLKTLDDRNFLINKLLSE